MEVCRIETLGERIRKIRKQQKLTLEGLAGKGLTKGMLSLIENNKANPSMESLKYISGRLGVEVSELLEEVSTQVLQKILESAEMLSNTEHNHVTDEYIQLITLVEPFVPKLTQGYESARLLEMYSKCLYIEKRDGWETLSDRAAQLYDQMNILPRRAKIGIFRATVKFVEHDYTEALKIMLQERLEIERNHAFIDPMTRIDLDYHEAVLYYAVGDAVSAIRVMDSAIEFSKKQRVFYNIDSLYRLAATHAMMTFDVDKARFYSKKLELYGEFAEDEEAIYFTRLLEVHYLNSYKHSYAEALHLARLHNRDYESSEFYSPYFNLEIGKSLFGLDKCKEALESLKKVEIADSIHHPVDLSQLYERDAYMARCYLELGNKKDALYHAQIALDNISFMPHTPYKNFIIETYELVKK